MSLAVLLPQLVQKMLEAGRETGRFRAQALLQPFPHGVADRPAGLVVDPFAVVGASAVHDGFLLRSFNLIDTLHQVMALGIVSRAASIAWLLVKIA